MLVGISYLSWSLATANNSQADKKDASPNSNRYPMMVTRIASDNYNKAEYSQANAYCHFRLHTLILPIKFCIRVYILVRRLSTRNEKNLR